MAIPPPPADSSMLSGAIPPPPANSSELRDSVAAPASAQGDGYSADSGNSPEQGKFLSQSLFSNEPVGFAGRTVRGIPAAVGGLLAGPAGAGGMESLRQVGVNLNATINGQQPASPLSVLGNVGSAAGLQAVGDAAAPYIASGVTKVAGAIGEVGQSIAQWVAKGPAGVPASSVATQAEAAPGAIRSYLGADPSVGDSLAQKVRTAISSALDRGGEAYKNIADAITGGPQNPVINLKGAIGDGVEQIKALHGYAAPIPGTEATTQATGLLDQYGKDISNVIPGKAPVEGVTRIVSPDEAAKFGKFSSLIGKMDKATPEQVYYLQRDINAAIQSNRGTPLGNALGSVKSLINKSLPQMAAESGSEGLAQLAKANSGYAAVKALEDQTGKLTNSNDLLNYISRVFKNSQDTLQKQAIEGAYPHVPGLEDAVNEIHAYGAAKDFTPLIRSLPQTGMGASILNGFVYDPIKNALGAAYVGDKFGHGLAAGVAAGASTFAKNLTVSPRLALGALEASQSLIGGSPAASKAIESATPLAAQAMRFMSTGSLGAYQRGLAEHYKSP